MVGGQFNNPFPHFIYRTRRIYSSLSYELFPPLIFSFFFLPMMANRNGKIQKQAVRPRRNNPRWNRNFRIVTKEILHGGQKQLLWCSVLYVAKDDVCFCIFKAELEFIFGLICQSTHQNYDFFFSVNKTRPLHG